MANRKARCEKSTTLHRARKHQPRHEVPRSVWTETHRLQAIALVDLLLARSARAGNAMTVGVSNAVMIPRQERARSSGNTNRLGESEQCERQCLHECGRLDQHQQRRRFTRSPIPRRSDRNIRAAAGLPRHSQQKRRALTGTPASSSPPSVFSSEQRQALARVEDAEFFERKARSAGCTEAQPG